VLKRTFIICLLCMINLFIPKIDSLYAWSYTVTAKVIGGNGKATPSVQKIQPGVDARIRITADLGYHIESIIDNSIPVKMTNMYASYTLTIKNVHETHDVVITFSINEYTIKATVSGGHGQVNPASQVVKFGEYLTIQITPDEGYHITGILDNNVSVSIKNPYTLENIKANHTIVVAFTSFTVSASVEDSNGVVSPASQTVHSGGRATINIFPNEGYMVKQILVNNRSYKVTNPLIIFPVTGNISVKVSFTTAIYTIKASSPDGFGTISVEPEQVVHNGSTKIRIRPNRGYSIKGITDNGIVLPIKDRIELKDIKENHTILVSFTEFEIKARMMNDNGSLHPTVQKMFYGGKAVIHIDIDKGYKVVSIKDNNRWMPVKVPYEIPNVKENHFVEITFGILTFSVTATVIGDFGEATPAKQTIHYGSRAVIQIHNYAGEKITGIVDNGQSMIIKNPYVINSVLEDHEIVITMKTYMISAKTNSENGYVYPEVQYLQQGQSSVVLLFPEVGYHIGSIKDNGTLADINNPYIINNVQENHDIFIDFVLNSYQISAKVTGQGGRVEPTTQSIQHGDKALIKIYPDEGYILESIIDNGLAMSLNQLYYIYYVTEDHQIEVKFSKKK